MNSQSTEDEIRERLASGDSSVLHDLWDLYVSDLLGYLMAILRSRSEAEDILQDVFVTIARKREKVAKARLLKPYLFGLSRNLALNHIKKRGRSRERDQKASHWLELNREVEDPDDRAPLMEVALGELPENQRTALVLKFYRGKSFREIGELLGISENTAGSRVRYGMEKMRKMMEALK